jgi:hypothetical protein
VGAGGGVSEAATTTTGRCVGSSSRSRWCRRRRRRRGKANLETRGERRPADRQRGARKAASGGSAVAAAMLHAAPEPNAAKVRHRRRASSLPPRRHRIYRCCPRAARRQREDKRASRTARRPQQSAARSSSARAATSPSRRRRLASVWCGACPLDDAVWRPVTSACCSSCRGKAGRCETCRSASMARQHAEGSAREPACPRLCVARAGHGGRDEEVASPSGRWVPPRRSSEQRANFTARLSVVLVGQPRLRQLCVLRRPRVASEKGSSVVAEALPGPWPRCSARAAQQVPSTRYLAEPSRLSSSAVRDC